MNPNENGFDLSAQIVRLIYFALFFGFLFLIFFGITSLIAPLIFALVLAFLLNPAADFLEGIGLPRFLCVIAVLGSVILIGYGIVQLVSLLTGDTVASISNTQSEALFHTLSVFAEQSIGYMKEHLPSFINLERFDFNTIAGYVLETAKDFSRNLLDIIPNLLSNIMVTLFILFFFLLEGDAIYNNLMKLIPNRFFEMTVQLVHKIKTSITSYLRGLAIQWTLIALIDTIGFSIIGLPFAPLLAVFVATVNMIPYIGPLIGITPPLLIAMLQPEGSLVIMTVAVFSIALIVDVVFTQPVILVRSVQLHPLVALLAIMTFQYFLGIAGMIIAIPTTGILLVSLGIMHRSLKAFRII